MANAWGELSWNIGSWGEQNDGSVSLTGLQVNCVLSSSSIAIGQQIDTTGQQINLSLDSVEAFGLAIIPVDGIALTTSLGSLDPAPDAEVTGEQLTISSPGVVTVTGEINSGWGRLGWGEFDWGTNTLSAQIDVTGISLSVTLDGVVAIPNTLVDLTGNNLVIEEGVVDPSPDAMVVGIGLSTSLSLGTVVEADANVTISGSDLVVSQGQAELNAVTFVILTGQQLQIALNSVVAGASAEVDLTGNLLTMSVGTINIQAWHIVDTGTIATWIPVDTAA